MALSPDHVAELIDLRVAELRLLAAQTAVEFWRMRPTLAERYFPALLWYGAPPSRFLPETAADLFVSSIFECKR